MASRMNPRKVVASVTAFVTILGVLFAAQVYAQVAGATLSGIVSDESGAVVPNAKISIKNVATGVIREISSNADGFYSAPNLLPGSYEVTVSATGFTTAVQTGITLTVGAQELLNLTMHVGKVTEKVEVNAAPPAVQLTSSTVSGYVDATTVRELPLNGRDWTQLATLEPGVVHIRAQALTATTNNRGNRGFGDQLSDSGHRPYENTYRVNGININDYSNGSPGSVLGVNLGVDAIQEFSVVMSNYTAESGRTSGAVINAVTKSGTNQFHGNGYFFDRDKIFDARNFVDTVRPPFRRIQFGASAGAPIVNDKTFIFGDYEGIRQSKGVTSTNVAPSDAARAGNVCSVPNACTPSGVSVDANVAKYLALFPRVNAGLVPASSKGNGDTGFFKTARSLAIRENYFTLRADHKISGNDSLAGTYFFDTAPLTQPDALNNYLNGVFTRRQMAGLEETHVFSPQLVNSARFGYSRVVGIVNNPVKGLNPAATDSSLRTVPVSGFFAPLVNLPVLTPNPTGGGLGSLSSFFHAWNSYQVSDDVFLVRGTHSFKFGFAFERMQYNLRGTLRQNGEFRFSSISNFLTNHPNRLTVQDPSVSRETGSRQSLFGGYFQDDWRARSNLTLNLGLRYEMVTLPTEAHDGFQVIANLSGGTVGPVKHLFASNPTLRNFEPRIGFSWDPFRDGKTAVRAGFGIFDVLPIPYVYTQFNSSAFPFLVQAVVNDSTATPLAGTFPNGGFSSVSFNVNKLRSRFFEQNPHRSYAMNWNLNIQREFARNLTAMVAYVGSHTLHESFTLDDANMVIPTAVNGRLFWPCDTSTTPCTTGKGTVVDPNAGPIRPVFFDGTASYHGLQAQLKKRMSHGFQAQASYTWSKCIDTGSSGPVGDVFQNSLSTLPFFSNSARRGTCDFDIHHNFVANYIWNIPSPKLSSAFASWALGEWELGGVIIASTGTPFTVLMGGDPLGQKNDDPTDFPDRLNGPGCNNPVNSGNINYLKVSCFAPPVPLNRCGNAGRNQLTGPGLFNVDFSIFKNNPVRRISESFNVQFRAEFFNLFNRANFQAPLDNNRLFNQNGIPIAGAGQITATATDARQIQFGLKLIW